MRILAVLAVIALAIIAAIIHFSDQDLGLTAKPIELPSPAQVQGSPGPAVEESFAGVAGSLVHDMSSIPTSLDAPGVPPRAAFNVKSRLAAAASTRKEYQTLVQACDLIIYADQEHSVRQAQVRQARQGISGNLMASAQENNLHASTTRTSLQTQAQADWDAYRSQTDREVTRLLHSLP